VRGNPHAAFDEAGAGNAAWSRWCDTRRRKSKPTGNTNFNLNRRARPRPHRSEVRRKPSLPLPVRGRFDLNSASLPVLLPEFAVVLAVELLGRKHERPIIRMERLELARSVEDRPG
jgi:hypothetical protein